MLTFTLMEVHKAEQMYSGFHPAGTTLKVCVITGIIVLIVKFTVNNMVT
jgi:hypothetical protein